jgi:multiple sugar transport system ATP-binding protein
LTPNIVERLGLHTIAYSPLPTGENFTSLFEGNPAIEDGKPLAIGIDPAQCHLFVADGKALSRR